VVGEALILDARGADERVMSFVLAPLRAGQRLLDRLAQLDTAPSSTSRGAVGIRRTLGIGAGLAGVILSIQAIAEGSTPGIGNVVMVLLAVALYTNHFGRFMRDWAPVLVLIFAYALCFGLVEQFSLRIWYWPQIHADEVIGFGALPTYRLQDWFGAADNHLLAEFSAIAYISHFLIPPLIGFYLWWFRRGEGFKVYMYSLIVVNLLASVPWVLTPTAPPWLAAQEGLIAAPVDVLRMGLSDLGLTQLVAFKDSNTYLIAAAVPSIHASWPLLGMLVWRRYRLPNWLGAAIVAQLVSVWFVIVYSGEHYAIDIVMGVIFTLAAWRLTLLLERRISAGRPGPPDDAEGGDPEVVVVRVPVTEPAPTRR
jgi:hypothetical protein